MKNYRTYQPTRAFCSVPNPFPEVCPVPATFLETMVPLSFVIADPGCPAPAIDLELLPPELTRQPPEWVRRVQRRFDETVLGELLSWLKPPMTWRVLGRLAGSINRFLHFMEHEVPKLLPGEEQLAGLSEERLVELDSKLSLEPLRRVLAKRVGREVRPDEDVDDLAEEATNRHLNHMRELVDFLGRQAAKRPAADGLEYHRGLPEGYEAVLDARGEFTHQTARTNTYLELLVHWPAIEQLRQRQPSITRGELYAWLVAQGVWASPPGLDWFNDLCDEIKLGTKRPGRPHKRN